VDGVAKLLLADFASRRYARASPPATWLICQPIGGVVAYLSYRTRIRPALLTSASLLFGIAGCAAFATAGTGWAFLLSGALLGASYVCDCADGQLARATASTSYRGAWLDIVVDSTIVVGLALAVMSQSVGTSQLPAFLASLLLGGGRIASLLTTSLSRREQERHAWQSQGLVRLMRVGYVAIIDTPVAYTILVVAAVAEFPLYFVASALGAASFGHALVIGNRIYPITTPLDHPEVPRPVA